MRSYSRLYIYIDLIVDVKIMIIRDTIVLYIVICDNISIRSCEVYACNVQRSEREGKSYGWLVCLSLVKSLCFVLFCLFVCLLGRLFVCLFWFFSHIVDVLCFPLINH